MNGHMVQKSLLNYINLIIFYANYSQDDMNYLHAAPHC